MVSGSGAARVCGLEVKEKKVRRAIVRSLDFVIARRTFARA